MQVHRRENLLKYTAQKRRKPDRGIRKNQPPVTVRKMTEEEWENRKMSTPQYNEHGGIIHQVEGVVGVGSDSAQVDPSTPPADEQ